MGHRHLFNTQIFENDSDQGWNHAEQPYMPMARSAPESSSIMQPVDNMPIQGGQFPSHWPPAPRPNTYSPSILNTELPHYQPMPPGPSHDPFLHQTPPGNHHILQDNNYSHHPSSSNIGGQTIPGVENGFYDHPIGSGNRGPYKRKSPGIPPMCDRGSSSRYYDVGSSSDIHLPADPWQEKQNNESYHNHWEYPPSYGVNSLSIGGEGTLRNVRSRGAADLETNLARTHLSSNSLHHQSNSLDFWGRSSNAAPRDWNRAHVSPPAPGVTFNSDTNFYSHDPNSMNTLNSHSRPNSSIEVGGGYNDVVTSNRTHHIPQSVIGHINQSVRGARSGYGQRSAPTFRASSSSNFRPGHVAGALDEGHHMVAESYPSRHHRAFSNLRLRNVDRSGRNFVSSDRYRSFPEDAGFLDRLTPEGHMAVDHSAYYGSRTLFDQHRDMRLDIDNMSYEELLALGESIGSVNTGLSDGLISKCLTESIYCSSDLSQDEGTCVICLEEYKTMDDVGTLKGCGHDFHVGCIRKWLSMKNLCPICKKAAVDDTVKDK